MPGSDGLVSCVGGCNSKVFQSRRVHRPLVDSSLPTNIHPATLEKPDKFELSRNRYRSIDPTVCRPIKGVKKMRKRRDRKASGVQQDIVIELPHEFDDDEATHSRPLLIQFLFWFCGILIVILGLGALVYAVIVLFTSMEKLTKGTTSKTDADNKQICKFSGKLFSVGNNIGPCDTKFPS